MTHPEGGDVTHPEGGDGLVADEDVAFDEDVLDVVLGQSLTDLVQQRVPLPTNTHT